jgi:Fe-S cluster biogenesis protein NfuA
MNNTTSNKYITIYTEANPNPNSLKFVLNTMLLPEGATFDFPDLASTNNCPLAKELFENYSYVKRVFVMNNFVTVTKNEEITWNDIASQIKKHIKEYFEQGTPLFSKEILKQYEQALNDPNEPEINKKIKQILDEYVKPAVESDGGAITFQSFEQGIVTVQLQGSCSGCPSSTLTLKSGIENLLKRMIPEVQSVVAQNEII